MNHSSFAMHFGYKACIRTTPLLKLVLCLFGLLIASVQAQGQWYFEQWHFTEVGDPSAEYVYTVASDMGDAGARTNLIKLADQNNKIAKKKKKKKQTEEYHEIILPERLQFARKPYYPMPNTNTVYLTEIVSHRSYNAAVDSALAIAVNEPYPFVGAGSQLISYNVFAVTKHNGVYTAAVNVVVKLPESKQATASFKLDTAQEKKAFLIKRANSVKAVTKYFEFMSDYMPKHIDWKLTFEKTAKPPVKGKITFRFKGDDFINYFFDVLLYSSIINVPDEERDEYGHLKNSFRVRLSRLNDLDHNLYERNPQATNKYPSADWAYLPKEPFQRNYGNYYEYTRDSGFCYGLPHYRLCVETNLSTTWLQENAIIKNAESFDIIKHLREDKERFPNPLLVKPEIPISIQMSQEEFEKTETIELITFDELNFGRKLSVLSSVSNDNLYNQLYYFMKSQKQLTSEQVQALEQTKKSRLQKSYYAAKINEISEEIRSIRHTLYKNKSFSWNAHADKVRGITRIDIINESIQLINKCIILQEEVADYSKILNNQDKVRECEAAINELKKEKEEWLHELEFQKNPKKFLRE